MMRQDDRAEAKPYKTYRGGRGRRTSLDEELVRAGRTDRPDKDYRVYRPPPGGAQATKKSASGPRRRRRLRWWHAPALILAVLGIAGVILTVLAWPGYSKFDRAVAKANRRVDASTRAQLDRGGWILGGGTTVAVFGIDAASLPAHSDTILLMRFDPRSRKINQLSIPRDTLVDLDGHGRQKLAVAMWLGGPPLALQAVREYTGIPINHVMIVSFKGFPRLVNSVGGIDMYVPQTVTTTAGSGRRLVTFEKGRRHFDGKDAMLYVRIRKAYAGGDFTRAKRQQEFIEALQKKIVRPQNITRIPEIGQRFMSGVSTDLTTRQLLELAFLKWYANGGTKQVLKGELGWYEGQAVVFPADEDVKRRATERFLGR